MWYFPKRKKLEIESKVMTLKWEVVPCGFWKSRHPLSSHANANGKYSLQLYWRRILHPSPQFKEHCGTLTAHMLPIWEWEVMYCSEDFLLIRWLYMQCGIVFWEQQLPFIQDTGQYYQQVWKQGRGWFQSPNIGLDQRTLQLWSGSTSASSEELLFKLNHASCCCSRWWRGSLLMQCSF